jgi:hypothetical protein
MSGQSKLCVYSRFSVPASFFYGCAAAFAYCPQLFRQKRGGGNPVTPNVNSGILCEETKPGRSPEPDNSLSLQLNAAHPTGGRKLVIVNT